MKQIIITLSLFLFSCNTDSVTISKDEYKQLTGDTIKFEYPKHVTIDDMDWEITLGSDGHEYYDNDAGNAYNCFHSPDCKYCKKDTL